MSIKVPEQLADADAYREVYNTTERHPCPVKDCRLSAEEHHRIAYGLVQENASLRRAAQAPKDEPMGDAPTLLSQIEITAQVLRQRDRLREELSRLRAEGSR